VIEFGTFGEPAPAVAEDFGVDDTILEQGVLEEVGRAVESLRAEKSGCTAGADPWHGPEVELVFDPYADPFEEYFEQEERVVERFVMRGPDDFSAHAHVSSREGLSMARQLDACELPQQQPQPQPSIALAVTEPPADEAGDPDDSDMVVIEEDLVEHPADIHKKSIFTVRPGDYRSLFARLRRGDR